MTRGGAVQWLERHQVALYLAALGVGAVVGLVVPEAAGGFEVAITPVLGALLFATFLGVPVIRLPEALRDPRFLATVMVLNFVVVPAIVFALTRFVADDGALLVGALLVLLAPCVDYVIVFTALAGGAKERLLAATPLLMVAQLVLLPVYVSLFAGDADIVSLDPTPLLGAFALLIVLPLALAAVVQGLAAQTPPAGEVPSRGMPAGRVGRAISRGIGAAMVPLMMATLAVAVASQVAGVGSELGTLGRLVPIYVAFAVVMPLVAVGGARVARLDTAAGRAAVFSATTRNSLVVLPLALSVAPTLPLAPLAVVTQTLVELLAMVVLVAMVPRLLPTPAPPAPPPRGR
ncbi:arsenic resistance protein [Subtercola boreus]|uniref:Arsenic resistance protein n=1 Tax=Subtercola boreus TaxID=120213 RepID=A0A3E0WCN7_9MICO|nr:arsenic resistance protein [Subtercola boreus]RFA21127.1 arsenic resistance protein [Subtercola boreus]RFA21510.1 arsenic resistance protein [Subtercola boreus]RFA27480.1 arsenic resistance protein [Subtercola boreus]